MKFGQILLTDSVLSEENKEYKYYHYNIEIANIPSVPQLVQIYYMEDNKKTPVFQKTIVNINEKIDFIWNSDILNNLQYNGFTPGSTECNGIKNILNIGESEIADRIGIQAIPGTALCINGELIRVGISGTYEVNFDMDGGVYFVGVLNGYNDFFILDYRYGSISQQGGGIDSPGSGEGTGDTLETEDNNGGTE